MVITNNELKNIKKLKDKKYRRLNNLFLVEGKKSCEELIKSNYKIIKTLASNSEYDFMPNFIFVDYDILKSIATTTTPQDIVCVVEIPIESPKVVKSNCLILDNLQDAGNIGTLIRSAVAFGFKNIYFIDCVDIFSEKVIRASMGAIFKIIPHFVDRQFIISNKQLICDTLVGTDLRSKPIKAIPKNQNIGLIIGNEGNGVSSELLNNTDINVTLDMDKSIESLNAGVAGSIIMFEIYKGER